MVAAPGPGRYSRHGLTATPLLPVRKPRGSTMTAPVPTTRVGGRATSILAGALLTISVSRLLAAILAAASLV